MKRAGAQWIFFLVAASLAACGPAPDGQPCHYQSDCVHACIMNGDPLGDGTCGPYRKLGETCTRPGYMENDCEPGLHCSQNAVCVDTTSSGGGTSCPSGQIYVNGYGCTPQCTSNGDCSTGCCASAGGGQYELCAPSSYCPGGGGGGGGGNTCTDESSCLTSAGIKDVGGCGGGNEYYTSTFTNNCGVSIWCKQCMGTDCSGQDWTYSPGETEGGWSAFLWCVPPGTGLKWACVLSTESQTCLANWP